MVRSIKDVSLVSMAVRSGRSKFGPTDQQNRRKQVRPRYPYGHNSMFMHDQVGFDPSQDMIRVMIRAGSRIFCRGGIDPFWGGFGLQRGHFSVKMYAKTKEFGPVGGHALAYPLDPPMMIVWVGSGGPS